MAVSDALRRLCGAGWVFTYPRDAEGWITVGYAVRVWAGGWWDGLILHAEHECEAMRVDPSSLLTWHREGTVLDMIHAVTELPAPGARWAPTLANGHRAPWRPGPDH